MQDWTTGPPLHQCEAGLVQIGEGAGWCSKPPSHPFPLKGVLEYYYVETSSETSKANISSAKASASAELTGDEFQAITEHMQDPLNPGHTKPGVSSGSGLVAWGL